MPGVRGHTLKFHRPKVQTALIVAGLFLIGVTTTVAVAWGLAFRNVHDWGRRTKEYMASEDQRSDSEWTVSLMWTRSPGAQILVSEIWSYYEPTLSRDTLASSDLDIGVSADRTGFAWAAPIVAPWPLGDAKHPDHCQWRAVDARGWPLLSMYSVTEQDTIRGRRTLGGIPVPSRRTDVRGILGGHSQSVVIPLHPFWRGVAADSAFYAVAWAALFYPVGAIRRRLRRRTGDCRRCGYNLSGNTTGVCPECGKGAAA
jgi:hypothetical protein